MSRFTFPVVLMAFGCGALAVGVSPVSVIAQTGRADTLRLSIQDAVAIAQRMSDEARLSAAQVDVADAQVALARASGLPQLRINSSYSHVYENARSTAVNAVFNQPNTYSVTAALSQPLFQGGRIVAASRAAADVRAASRLDEQETRSKLNVDVQRAYLGVLYNARLVDIQRGNVTLANARLEQIERLQSAGRAARYDVLRARVERANLEPLAIQAENNRELAMLELKRLLNVPVAQPLQLTTTLDPAAVRAMAPVMASLVDSISTGLPDRPSLRSAELSTQARREALRIARADFLPSLSLNFNTGYQAFPPLGFGFPDRFGRAAAEFCPDASTSGRVCQNGGWFADRSIGATLSFPVFDGFRARSNLGLARAQLRIAELQLQQERETVAIEVARGRAELRRARSMFETREQNSTEAKEAFQLASLRFSRGLSTQLEVSDAQLALLIAESGEAQAMYDLYLASAELARALGQPIPFPPGTVPAIRRSENGTQR